MMRKVLKFGLLLWVFTLSQGIPALASDKVGITGVAFLKIPCGARAIVHLGLWPMMPMPSIEILRDLLSLPRERLPLHTLPTLRR